MRITVEVGRPARRSLAIVLGLVLVALPGVALASHMFNDVPADHPFHTEISAIAGAGITAGFPDGGYHPADNVTRQAMAAFLERGLGHVVHDGATAESETLDVLAGAANSADVIVKEFTFTVPGSANGLNPLQHVYVAGRVQLSGSMGPDAGCPCVITAQIADVTGGESGPVAAMTFESSQSEIQPYAVVTDTLYVVPPGPRVFKLFISVSDRFDPTNAASWDISALSTLTAMSFAFGEPGQGDD